MWWLDGMSNEHKSAKEVKLVVRIMEGVDIMNV